MFRHRGLVVTAVVVGVVLLGFGWGSLVGAKTPGPVAPTIDQILGIYSVTASHVAYDLFDGTQEKIQAKGTYAITKLDDTTVNIHYEDADNDWDNSFYYGGGVLLMGAADDDTLASWAQIDTIILKGKPGKLSGKGQFIAYDANEEALVVGTISVKEIAEP